MQESESHWRLPALEATLVMIIMITSSSAGPEGLYFLYLLSNFELPYLRGDEEGCAVTFARCHPFLSEVVINL